MKVLFIHRKGVFSYQGGEQDQVRKTQAVLAEAGADVTLADTMPQDRASYDLVHFFGLDACHIPEIERAKGMPKVLTPVFWNPAQGHPVDCDFEPWPRGPMDSLGCWFASHFGSRDRRVTRNARRQLYAGLSRFAEFQSAVDDIDLFLPNSEAEMDSLRTFYVIENGRHQVVPNAIDMRAVDNPSDYARHNLSFTGPFVCCSGSIDRRKNQYGLIKALMDVDVPLVFAGSVRDSRYMRAVRRIALRRKGVFFLGHLSEADLHSIYRAAAVHALPSFYDTPGISNLEAVAHECRNVSTQIGGLREYLAEHSLYCNPYSTDHIRQQVVKAFDLPPNVEGAAVVRQRFTYQQVAAATLGAYSSVLAGKGGE